MSKARHKKTTSQGGGFFVGVDVGRNGSIINSLIEECFTWH